MYILNVKPALITYEKLSNAKLLDGAEINRDLSMNCHIKR